MGAKELVDHDDGWRRLLAKGSAMTIAIHNSGSFFAELIMIMERIAKGIMSRNRNRIENTESRGVICTFCTYLSTVDAGLNEDVV